MDVNVLIDAVVRQTTVLIAQLATATGGRATLAHTANQVFVDLVRELKDQGLGNKVIADMFGLALRTYRGKSLWEATLEFVQEKDVVLQAEVLLRFSGDDEATVRSVLTDLVDTGMVFRSGRGTKTTYRAARPEERALADDAGEDAAAQLVWVAVSRFGPVTADGVGEIVPVERGALDAALDRLVAEGHIARVERAGAVEYRTDLCLIPFGAPAGWEAAVFDHYQAVVTAICTKLRNGARSSPDDRVGGSTFGFNVWRDHPHYDEAVKLLGKLRGEAILLREKITDYNATHSPPDGEAMRVICYMGQTVIDPEQG
jgi:predicted transcriptional regulator